MSGMCPFSNTSGHKGQQQNASQSTSGSARQSTQGSRGGRAYGSVKDCEGRLRPDGSSVALRYQYKTWQGEGEMRLRETKNKGRESVRSPKQSLSVRFGSLKIEKGAMQRGN